MYLILQPHIKPVVVGISAVSIIHFVYNYLTHSCVRSKIEHIVKRCKHKVIL